MDDKQVVLITGAVGNLGRATAEAFAAEDVRLALFDRSEDGLNSLTTALPAKTEHLSVAMNLFDPESVEHAVQQTLGHFGRIDILANIAGGFTMGPQLHETSDADWDFMMNLNARSVFYMSRAVIPSMLSAGGGRIINVSARAAKEGKAKMGAYCASKAVVINLTETLAAEHKDAGINVNCILPGTIDTPQNRSDMPDADHSKWVPPAALADVALFLASDAARCVTGAAIPVFGQS